jgi:hypothetical protein
MTLLFEGVYYACDPPVLIAIPDFKIDNTGGWPDNHHKRIVYPKARPNLDWEPVAQLGIGRER